MNFMEIAKNRQSCRSYEEGRAVEQEKLDAILEAARLAPSACNGQPYHINVCRGETAQVVAKATQGMGMNKFASQADVLLVISEENYVKSAAVGAKVKGNDYRSIDIGIVCAYITAEAAAQGLGSQLYCRAGNVQLHHPIQHPLGCKIGFYFLNRHSVVLLITDLIKIS